MNNENNELTPLHPCLFIGVTTFWLRCIWMGNLILSTSKNLFSILREYSSGVSGWSINAVTIITHRLPSRPVSVETEESHPACLSPEAWALFLCRNRVRNLWGEHGIAFSIFLIGFFPLEILLTAVIVGDLTTPFAYVDEESGRFSLHLSCGSSPVFREYLPPHLKFNQTI